MELESELASNLVGAIRHLHAKQQGDLQYDCDSGWWLTIRLTRPCRRPSFSFSACRSCRRDDESIAQGQAGQVEASRAGPAAALVNARFNARDIDNASTPIAKYAFAIFSADCTPTQRHQGTGTIRCEPRSCVSPICLLAEVRLEIHRSRRNTEHNQGRRWGIDLGAT